MRFDTGKTVKEIAASIQGEVLGNPEAVIRGVSGIQEAKEGDITFLANAKYASYVSKTKASCIVVSRDMVSVPGKTFIRTDHPSFAFIKVVELFSPITVPPLSGISPHSKRGKNVHVGKDVAIGDFAVIEDDVWLEDGVVIYPGVYIGHQTRIGEGTILYPHVVIRERVEIGKRVIIHSNSVIGADGFGYMEIEGAHYKIPQVGSVSIGDDVEIGACVTIDRARFGKTSIARGVKIDNLVQIAHNVEIGEHTIIVAQAGISGSTKVGKKVILAGQAGISGHLTIGDGAIVGAQGGVIKSIPPGTFVSGYPARPHLESMRGYAAMAMLPDLIKEFRAMKKRVDQLEGKSHGNAEDHTN